jgi:hypothetical protein
MATVKISSTIAKTKGVAGPDSYMMPKRAAAGTDARVLRVPISPIIRPLLSWGMRSAIRALKAGYQKAWLTAKRTWDAKRGMTPLEKMKRTITGVENR